MIFDRIAYLTTDTSLSRRSFLTASAAGERES